MRSLLLALCLLPACAPELTAQLDAAHPYTLTAPACTGDGAILQVTLDGTTDARHTVKATIDGICVGLLKWQGQIVLVRDFPVARNRDAISGELVNVELVALGGAGDVSEVFDLRLTCAQ